MKEMSTTTLVSKVLKRTAEIIWEKMGKEGQPPTPTLQQIQEIAITQSEGGANYIVADIADSYVIFDGKVVSYFDQLPPPQLPPPMDMQKILAMCVIASQADIEDDITRLQQMLKGDAILQEVKKRDIPESEKPHIEAVTTEIIEGIIAQRKESVSELEGARITEYKRYPIIARHIAETAGEPSENIIRELHEEWRYDRENYKKEIGTEYPEELKNHPLELVVREWINIQLRTQITLERDEKKPASVLKHPIGSFRETDCTDNIGKVFATPERSEQVEQQILPIGEKEKSILPNITPLRIVQPDMKTKTKSGAVSHELRIFFEAMMALEPNQKRGELMFRLGDLINFLYPNDKFHWTNQMPHIARALHNLHVGATIPWIDDQGDWREWRPVTVLSPLPQQPTRETPIFINVILPPDSRQGYMVLKNNHRMISMKSAAQWNAYHVACYLWDKFGTRDGKILDPTKPIERRDEQNRLLDQSGKPIVTPRGKEIKNLYDTEAVRQLDREEKIETIQKYPLLSWDDLINACYPNGYREESRREYLSRAKKHWQTLEKDGYICIHKEKKGWRILPTEDHIATYRALKKASETQ